MAKSQLSNFVNAAGTVDSVEENNCSFMNSFGGGKPLTQAPWWEVFREGVPWTPESNQLYFPEGKYIYDFG